MSVPIITTLSDKFRDITLAFFAWIYKYQPAKAKKLTPDEWILVVLIVIAMNVSYLLYTQFYEFKLNVSTKSLPGTLFLLEKKQLPNKNDFVIAHLPKDNRFYADKNLLKLVKGVAGDKVEVNDSVLYINGKDMGKVKRVLLSGDIMYPITTKPLIIPEGYYFLWSPHKDTYDSRYRSVGLINKNRIVGKAYEIF